MSKTITNAQILEAINNISKQFDSLNKRVEALEGKSKPSNSSKGNPNKSVLSDVEQAVVILDPNSPYAKELVEREKRATKGFSTDLKDYEPKKAADGNYNWASYKAKRTDYCYAVATKGEALGCYKDGVKVVEFDDIKEAFNKAKAEFTANYKYVKVADR